MMDEDQARFVPSSDLDLNLMLTDSLWGRDEVKEMKEKLQKYSDDSDVVLKSSLWGMLSFLTRDLRLGNLSVWDGELQFCRYHLLLAGDLLDANMIEPFVICILRSASTLETSQSKGGFLRRNMNTLRQEHVSEQREPPKKGFFGGKKTDRGRM